jgi:hypothetical protein
MEEYSINSQIQIMAEARRVSASKRRITIIAAALVGGSLSFASPLTNNGESKINLTRANNKARNEEIRTRARKHNLVPPAADADADDAFAEFFLTLCGHGGFWVLDDILKTLKLH